MPTTVPPLRPGPTDHSRPASANGWGAMVQVAHGLGRGDQVRWLMNRPFPSGQTLVKTLPKYVVSKNLCVVAMIRNNTRVPGLTLCEESSTLDLCFVSGKG